MYLLKKLACTPLLALVIAASFTHQAAAQCSTVGGTCTLVWSDEFDGTSLDLSKWEYMTGNGCQFGICNWGNNEKQWYTTTNTTVVDGQLTISAKKDFPVGGYDYSSSRIRTLNQGDWKYGRFEMRAKLPANQYGAGQGSWPAFWMLSSDPSTYGGWPSSGEIDIMEWLGDDANNLFGTLHYGNPGQGSANDTSNTPLPNSQSFHTYAVEWEANEFRWYLDGELYFTRTGWGCCNGSPGYPAPFDVDFHILLNLAVGGNFPGDPDANSIFPQDYVIDYVRVFEWGGAGGGEPADPPAEQATVLVDNFEHNNPGPNGWFVFDSVAIGNNVSNVPPQNGESWAMSVSRASNSGYSGGFGRGIVIDLTDITKFSFWINPSAGQTYTVQVLIQDDDNGNLVMDSSDDEFQYDCVVSPTGPCAVAGDGWQKVEIALTDFYDDNSFWTGGNGALDTAAGGNGFGINVLITLEGTGTAINFDTDYWLFEGEPVAGPLPTENVPLPWFALVGMGAGLLSIGVWGRSRLTRQA